MFFSKKNNINAVYSMHIIEGFASSLVGIFIPIYFLTLGYSISTVIIFFMIHHSLVLLVSLPSGYLIEKKGYLWPLILRIPLLFGFLLLVYILDTTPTPIYILAALSGAQSGLYWTALNILFAKNAPEKKMGSSISKLFALPKLPRLVGPLIAGFIAAFWGFKLLFIIAFIIFLLSLVPLFNSAAIKADFKFEFRKGIKFFKKHPKFIISEIFDNLGAEVEGIIWPIFIFLTLSNTIAVGMLKTFITLGTILFTLMVGNLSDKHDRRIFIRLGVLFILVIWFVRFYFDDEVVYFGSTLLAGFAYMLLMVPYTAMIFSQARKDVIDEFFIVKEIPTVFGRLLIYSIALLVISNLKLLFPITGILYLSFFIL